MQSYLCQEASVSKSEIPASLFKMLVFFLFFAFLVTLVISNGYHKGEKHLSNLK